MESNTAYTVCTSGNIEDFVLNFPLNVNATYEPKISGKFRLPVTEDCAHGYDTVYIREVIYSDPATIVLWSDGTKTVAKCAPGDEYNANSGLTLCILKKLIGGAKLHDIFDDWMPTTGNRVTLKNVRYKHNHSK